MSLSNLPGELLMEIADLLSESDLNSLVRSSRRCHFVLDHFLYRKQLVQYDRTGLYRATVCGQLEGVKKFMEIGVKFMTYENQLFYTPLLAASERGYLEIVQFLLEFGGTTHLKHCDYCDAMTLAIERGHTEVVKLFLDHGLDPESKLTSDGRRPLHVAAERGNEELVRLFLSLGVGQRLKDDTGSSALHLAVRKGHKTCTALLLRGHEDLLDESGNAQSPLESVIYTEHVGVLKTLFQNGAILSNAIITDFSPLFVAALLGRVEVVELLLNHGLDVNGLDLNGQMPPARPIYEYLDMFHYQWGGLWSEFDYQNVDIHMTLSVPLCVAAAMGHISVVKVLLNHGADANRIDQDGNLPLHLSALYGRRKVVSLLIAGGAKVNAVDVHGLPALRDAIWCDPELACNLLREGASAHLGDKDFILGAFSNSGNTMPQESINSFASHHDSIRCLHGCCGDDAEGVQGRDNFIGFSLQCGSDINSSDQHGRTLLHQAAYYLCNSTVQLLLDKGADPSPVDIFGQTPLHVALDFIPESLEIIRLLLKFGSNPDVEDHEGYTPLHRAILMGLVPVVEALLEDGRANVGSRTKDGKTPLELVYISNFTTESEKSEMARVLCDHGADPDCIARTSWALDKMELDEPSSTHPDDWVW